MIKCMKESDIMGFMDKLKNIFFEEDEEDEEIDEPVAPKKEKKVEKKKEKSELDDSKENKISIRESIAKKIELPKRNKIDNFDEKDNTWINKEEKPEVEKKIEKVEKKDVEIKPKRENKINTELIFDDEDFSLDVKPKVVKEKTRVSENKELNLYNAKEKEIKPIESKVVKSKTTVNVELPKASTPYAKGAEVKPKTFTPSPIISPIYGILDKNYKKEEVKENKEIRISSRPSRMDLDSVRNKAFGDLEYDLMNEFKESDEKEVKKEEPPKKTKTDIKKVYNTDDKPTIEKVTIGEADEYYNDLGLAYNTDYKDLSKDLNDGKVVEKTKEEKDNLEDNLFDLIESMYDKEE